MSPRAHPRSTSPASRPSTSTTSSTGPPGSPPWWFDTSGEGRFDLIDDLCGHGTCYTALDPITAVLETLGFDLPAVPRQFLADRTVWVLGYDAKYPVADLCAPAAVGFGVSNELSTMTPYDLPLQWASALHGVADGIAYRSRFDTTGRPAIAIFDDAGEHPDWPATRHCAGDDAEILGELASRRITVIDPPRLRDLDVIDP